MLTHHRNPKTVSLAVCSSGKSEYLVEGLRSLINQDVVAGWSLDSLIVVWNGTGSDIATARANLAESFLGLEEFPFPVLQFVEVRKGIPFARNRAVSEAIRRGAGWLFFTDDDCLAEPNLMFRLTEEAERTGAHVVAGGWQLVPSGQQSSWLPNGVFGVKHYQISGRDSRQGDLLPTAYTRNVLFDLAFISSLPERNRRFDESLAETGDSDTRFFYGVSNHGGKIVYAEHAMVTERYGGERLNLWWHVRRRIRNTQRRFLRAPETGEKVLTWPMVLRSLVAVLWRLPLTMLLLPATVRSVRLRRWIGASLLQLAPYLGLGLLVVGVRFHEYAGRFRFIPLWVRR